jgi:hypothetical protein
VSFHDVRAPQKKPTLIRIAFYGSVESGMSDVSIAIQRDGADRFAVLPKSLLLHSESQVLIDIGECGMSNLPQEVMQFRRHSKVAVPDFPAKIHQIDQ